MNTVINSEANTIWKSRINMGSTINFILFFVTIIIGVYCIAINFFSSQDYIFFGQWMLPMTYAITIFVFKDIFKYIKHFSVMWIVFNSFIRYVITPLVYYTMYDGVVLYPSYSTYSIFLMAYELIMVFCAIYIFASKYLTNNLIQAPCFKQKEKKEGITLGTKILIAVFLVTLATYPQYISNLYNFSFNEISSVEVDTSIDGFFNLIYITGLIVLSCLMLRNISNWKVSERAKVVFSCFSGILAIWVISQGTSGGISRTSFLSTGIIIAAILMNYYPRYRRGMAFFFATSIIALLIVGTSIRFGYGDNMNSISLHETISGVLNYQSLNGYYSGVENVNVAMKTKEYFSDRTSLITLFNDIFSPFPFLATRMGMDFDNRIVYYFNVTYFSGEISFSRIAPLIGQGYLYFGLLLSPIFSVIFTILAIKINRSLNRAESILKFYTSFLAMYFFAGFMGTNINVIMNGYWNKVLPLMIVLLVNGFILEKYKGRNNA